MLVARLVSALALCTTLAACTAESGVPSATPTPISPTSGTPDPEPSGTQGPEQSQGPEAGPELTLAFAGDLHFERHLDSLLTHPEDALAAVAPALRSADLAMVNLETAITERGRPEPKEYVFRTRPAALDVLAGAGVDVVTMANNHGADYGAQGFADTLQAKRHSPIPIVGIGRDRRAAFQPFRVTVKGVDLAFLAADTIALQSATPSWTAGPDHAGLAGARTPAADTLVRAVRRSSARGDVVVVYLHWGEENVACPTDRQQVLSQLLIEAGADVIVGSHSHVLMASGWAGDAYVNYGLANFVWYHDASPETGVLLLTLRDGQVSEDDWVPARITSAGTPRLLRATAAADAELAWRSLRGCSALRSAPGGDGEQAADVPAYTSSIKPVAGRVLDRARGSYRPGCPLPLSDLRYLNVGYVGFDGRAHRGELLVHRRYARSIVGVFEELYDARWPLRRMLLVDSYDADNDRSLAANNTSGFNCRPVAGTRRWSDHAFGAALDLNPVQNPYVVPGDLRPPSGAGFSRLDRAPGARLPDGTIGENDLVVRAFARIGWRWGGHFATPDYQHFYAPQPGS